MSTIANGKRSFFHFRVTPGSQILSPIDLGHNLGLKVVAEGVENQHNWNQLAHFGCDRAQGYFMCYPPSPNSSGNHAD